MLTTRTTFFDYIGKSFTDTDDNLHFQFTKIAILEMLPRSTRNYFSVISSLQNSHQLHHLQAPTSTHRARSLSKNDEARVSYSRLLLLYGIHFLHLRVAQLFFLRLSSQLPLLPQRRTLLGPHHLFPLHTTLHIVLWGNFF